MPTGMDTVLVTGMDTVMDTVSIRRIHTSPAFPSVISKPYNFAMPGFRLRLVLLVGVFIFRKAVSSNEFGGEEMLVRACLAPAPEGAGRSFASVVTRATSCDVRERLAEGNDRSRVALGPRSTADRLRVWIVSCTPPPAP